MRNYLRVRGEYNPPRCGSRPRGELPPRARRIPVVNSVEDFVLGTTSACAENTGLALPAPPPQGNYLRVRGEYSSQYACRTARWELPPRARRIPPTTSPRVDSHGTTSACAENTLDRVRSKPSTRNYLRVRGEYTLSPVFKSSGLELPPRARRIPLPPPPVTNPQGTTSACAENTLAGTFGNELHGNYLRVRGEYVLPTSRPSISRELPPRARRIRFCMPHSIGL